MIRYLLICFTLLISISAVAQTSLGGKVKDDNGEPVLFGNVVLYKQGVYLRGMNTDMDGNYIFSNLDPGTYAVEFSYTGLQSQKIEGVIVYAGKANKLDVELTTGVTLQEVVVIDYEVPLVEQDNTTQGGTVTSEQIRQLPTRNINAIATLTAGASSADEGEAISIRGSRSNATDYYIDGIRVSGALIPESEIEQLQVITGGMEAKYGDVTGGIISITTKGPSQKFSGTVDLETSKALDPYDNNIVGLGLSGPILKNKEGQSIIGYRISGRYTYRGDDDPPAVPVYVAKADKLAEIEANPITIINNNRILTAESLTNQDVDALNARPFEAFNRLDLTAKLEARLSQTIDIAFTGSYSSSENQFTPGGWRLLNAHHNPFDNNTTYRGNFRFRQRLGAANQDQEKSSIIQNISYYLQFGYEKNTRDQKDPRHGDNLFDYGYVGDFDFNWQPAIGPTTFTGAAQIPGTPVRLGHIDNTQVFSGYTPVDGGHPNAGLAASNGIADDSRFNDFVVTNGLFGYLNGPFSNVWSGLHTNANAVYNVNFKSEGEIYTFNANSSFDILPGGSEKGRHSIEFGVSYEQRVARSYRINPRRLWDLARLQSNRHILGVDTATVVGDTLINLGGAIGSLSVPLHGTRIATEGFEDNLFFKRVREITGQSLHEYVNVDGISPDQLSLDMFSAQELHGTRNILAYQGYDYLGNKITSDITFEDFFRARDANGIRTFPVAPVRPVYASAYIQDKFSFKDIIFRVGVRVDRYDANRKVLKDPYSLYEIMGARDFYAETGGELPAGIGDDYKVYLESPTSDAVKAFRDGDQWYFPNGNPANDGNVIFGNGVINPKFVNEDADIQSPDFDPNTSFEDYEPQINVMPRLAFSFPISDEANFFAHYDILVQRPQERTNATALDYLYFLDPNRTPTSNPNLKPQKTIDYEVGFQQKLSNDAAIKIAAYYKELRDMIQSRTYLFVPVLGSYNTFDNQDFGTVKGFSFQFDRRRRNNIQLQASYTLQFADGTGSDALSQRNLSQNGNLRTLFPLNFDERHRFNAVIDYRFGRGRRYTGPQWFGKDIFADAGMNLQATAVSGRPFTAKSVPREFGGDGTVGAINGARLPWNFTLNLRVDKNFTLTKPDAPHPVFLNVYCRVQNLLDARNILGVYSATGSADNDGYLASSDGVARVRNLETAGRDVQAFLDAYSWVLANPNFYSLPRRIFVGAIVEF
jgi:outer membrane receptor protein involved in Fe transport